jgi:hypothetical protein
MTDVERAWVAGLLEGEGSFVGEGRRTTVRAMMTDLDVLERLQQVVGCGHIYRVTSRAAHHKQAYLWQVRREMEVAGLAASISPLLCERRRGQLAKVGLLDGSVTVLQAGLHGMSSAWVAGILEGEGSLTVLRTTEVRIDVSSIDLDVITRLRHICQAGHIYAVRSRKPKWRPSHLFVVTRKDDVARILSATSPWLLRRRTNAAQKLLERCH